jgi:CRP/FNR family cyclic AMP-dependent transcriptional regulator
VRRITGVATDLVFLDLKQRVAKYLLQRALGAPPSVRSGVTQSELAANIGASRQRVNTCLRDFQRQGWISLESKSLRVLDPEALTRFVTL